MTYREPERWEYQVFEQSLKSPGPEGRQHALEARLDALGAEGWELVGVSEQPTFGTTRVVCFLKRRRDS
jgi:hypothetical protein